MSEDRDNGGPAFPLAEPADQMCSVSTGMSLRDYFAAKVCASLLTTTSADHDYPNREYKRDGDTSPTYALRIASISYQMADAMLEARK